MSIDLEAMKARLTYWKDRRTRYSAADNLAAIADALVVEVERLRADNEALLATVRAANEYADRHISGGRGPW